MSIIVLRIGHRSYRDKRISTHAGLTARAFGADKIIYSGEHDESLLKSINDVSARFGDDFKAVYEKNWIKIVNNYKKQGFKIAHLTMYGLQVQKIIPKMNAKDLLIIIGGEKVPSEIYELADYNVAVTNQPHSEVAALAVFLDHFFKGEELSKTFKNARIKIKPSIKGKEFYE